MTSSIDLIYSETEIAVESHISITKQMPRVQWPLFKFPFENEVREQNDKNLNNFERCLLKKITFIKG